jgi:hydrogenase maturation protease
MPACSTFLSDRARQPSVPRGRTVILGIGNTLLGDDGAGIHVINRLQSEGGWDDSIDFVDGGTVSFVLAGIIAEANSLVVVDAAQLGAPAGSLKVFENEEMDAFLGSDRQRSVHEVGLHDLMAIAHLAGRLPAPRALIAIQPARIDWSDLPSEPVARAIPGACEAARELIARWQA